MDISINDLSLGVMIGSNDLNLNEIKELYNERIKVLSFFNKIHGNDFNPLSFDKLISKYWGKTIENLNCQMYRCLLNNTKIYVFGILEKCITIEKNEEFENLFVVYLPKDNNLALLKKTEVESVIEGWEIYEHR